MPITVGTVVTGIVMLAALAGMIICAKRQRNNPKAQTFAIGLLVIVVLCGAGMLFQAGVIGPGVGGRTFAWEMKYARDKAVVLGEAIRTECANDKILVVVDRRYEKNERQQKQVDGLKEGLGGNCNIVTDSLDIVPIGPDGQPLSDEQISDYMMPVEELMKAQHYDDLLAKHPDCKTVVTLMGFPMNVGDMKVWSMDAESRPKIVVLNGDIHNLGMVIEKGMVLAAVTHRPDGVYEDKAPPADSKEAFDKRYILVTPKNIAELVQKYPHIFQMD